MIGSRRCAFADWRRTAATVGVLLGVIAAGVCAQEGQTETNVEAVPKPEQATGDIPVTNVFYETSLRQVLSDIAAQVGVIIVPDVSVRGLVTCELDNVPLDKALEIVLAGTGFIVKKTPHYYLICSADPESPSFVLVSKTQVVKLNHVGAAIAAKLLSAEFQKAVTADPESNTVCITATPEMLERIVADLKLIDRPLRHVMLNARIVVLTRSDLLNLGVQWTWPMIQAGIFTNSDFHGGGAAGPDWPWGLQIGYTTGKEFTNALLLTLNLLAQNDQATVIAAPQLMAQDGKEAEIKVAVEEYFQITTDAYYARSELEKIETGTVLRIIPRIGEDGEIALSIRTEVSDVIARGEDNLPVVTRRTAMSTVRLESGGTAAIAGLMNSRTQTRQSQVPGLHSLPLLGRLFQDDVGLGLTNQVAVFVTASIMPPAGEMRDQPDTERPALKLVEKQQFDRELAAALRRLHYERQL